MATTHELYVHWLLAERRAVAARRALTIDPATGQTRRGRIPEDELMAARQLQRLASAALLAYSAALGVPVSKWQGSGGHGVERPDSLGQAPGRHGLLGR